MNIYFLSIVTPQRYGWMPVLNGKDKVDLRKNKDKEDLQKDKDKVDLQKDKDKVDLHRLSICESQSGSHFLHPAEKIGGGGYSKLIQYLNDIEPFIKGLLFQSSIPMACHCEVLLLLK